MDTSGSAHRPPPSSWQRPASSALAALGLVALAVLVVGAATAIEQHANPPTCFGIGFGCTPDAVSTMTLLAMFAGGPVVAVAWLLIVAGWALTRHRSDRTNRCATWWPSWLLAGILGLITVLAVFTAV